jgi:hypothetical protein
MREDNERFITSHYKVLASENFNPEPAPSTCGQSSIDVTYETCSNAATNTKTVNFTSDHGYQLPQRYITTADAYLENNFKRNGNDSLVYTVLCSNNRWE